MKLQTEVAGIRLEHPLMNAAGTCKSLEDVRKLSRSASAAVVVGSITLKPRTGQTGNVYWAGPMFSLNSLGLPNLGATYYKTAMPAMAAMAHDKGKPFFVSVAGFSGAEYVELADLALNSGADLVELNLACPNVWHGHSQERIPCFNSALVDEILCCVESGVGESAKMSVKITPFSDPFALAEVAQVISASKVVKVVTATNTFPNAFDYDGAKPRIMLGGGLAGMGGPALKPIALGHVVQLRTLLPRWIEIIGVGGITHGQDILEYRQGGAAAVQVATSYLNQGETVFSSLLSEFLEFVSE